MTNLFSDNNNLTAFDDEVPADALSGRHIEYLPFLLWLLSDIASTQPHVNVTFTRSCAHLIEPLRQMLGESLFEQAILLIPLRGEPDLPAIIVCAADDAEVIAHDSSILLVRFGENPIRSGAVFRLDQHLSLMGTDATQPPRCAPTWLFDPDAQVQRRALRRRATNTAALWRLRRDHARMKAEGARASLEQQRLFVDHRTLSRQLLDTQQARDTAIRDRDRMTAERDTAIATYEAAQQHWHDRPSLPDRVLRRIARTREKTPPPPPPIPPPETPAPSDRRHILFIAGEPNTPGVAYRCDRLADAARAAGYAAIVKPCAAISGEDVAWADFMVLWRVEYSGHVEILIRLGREKGAVLIFDADDIVFVPHLARIEIIDGIRSIGATEDRIERCFADMRRTMLRCDLGFATTRELADVMRINLTLTHEIPNVFDTTTLSRARLARRLRGHADHHADGLVRIGYATGSRTHQRDFAPIVPVIADILRTHPQVRLVLFQEAANKRPVLLMEEFPSLLEHADQIEWRDMVGLADLPDEFSRFDISIAPLETGNVFCEAKSEIKFIEPALAGTVCIASPTGPFKRLIRPDVTGLLADTPEEWSDALHALIDNPAKRHAMARDAYHDVLWRFGPQAQAQRLRAIFDGLGTNNEADAARTAETLLARQALAPAALPVIPESSVLFHRDRFAEATVSVVVTCYNYDTYILDALDSVRDQTLTPLDLIVIDDHSSDESVPRIQAWMERHADRFNRLILHRTVHNAGLGGARNVGMAAAETPLIMQLDADNRLLPEACAILCAAMADNETAYAYPILRAFNERGIVMGEPNPDDPGATGRPALLGDLPFEPLALVGGNHVDAMAMVAKWAWAAAGGYYVSRDAMGWEDYDLWCGLAERGLKGKHVAQILAEYRQHSGSMTNGTTERAAHKARVVAHVTQRHPWVRLVAAEARQRQ